MRQSDLLVVAHHLGTQPPLDPVPSCVVLLELAGEGDLIDQLAAVFDAIGDRIRASAVATDDLDRARLWRWREAHPEAAAALGLVHKADVSLPLPSLARFAAEVDGVVAGGAPASTVLLYGHLGDGNLHVNVVGPEAGDEAVLDAVYELVLLHGGSVSAEHGIGVAKRHWLERQRGAAAVAAMRAIKEACDPDGILNPGVLLPD
jgi:FAD/FMN-containing dehydrogenase